jgi:acetyl/propionyl-CoA carboxylase alpha subunit/acetyl-CoA carboxylase carboxyltransferase component
MPIRACLIANRGEIAIRIARAAAELGIRSVAVYSEDDVTSLHVRRADEARALSGSGPAAYLDGAQLVAVARAAGCDALHPGYGFLAERGDFARRCHDAGLVFVGPRPEVLDLFGDKARARALAEQTGVPVLAGTSGPTSLEDARRFLGSLGRGGTIVVKAIAGGGGRGLRVVADDAELDAAYARCRSEAGAALGCDEVYVERFMPSARHVEVQVLGDGAVVTHLWERECTLQRRHQKLVEVAPSPSVSPDLRARLVDAALGLARAVRYDGAGTFEFLVDGDSFAFIEANPRLQVEHTVTEMVTGIDVVQAQLGLASGASLAALGIAQSAVPAPRGFAVQARVNLETMAADGTTRPAGGTVTAFEPPTGPGIRVDGFGYAGYETSPRFDSLLAKVIAHVPAGDWAAVARKAARALAEFRIEGVATNLGFLQALLEHPAVLENRVHTRFVEEHAAELATTAAARDGGLALDRARRGGLAGARIDASDPLGVLHHGKSAAPARPAAEGDDDAAGTVRAALQGTIVAVDVREGDLVYAGQQLLVMEAMKMEHVIAAPVAGRVRRIAVAVGDAVLEGHALVVVEASEDADVVAAGDEIVDPDRIRPELDEVRARHAIGLDAARPDAVARRRKTGQRTARENVDDLCDAESFVEYGALAIAAQRRRRSVEELIEKTPADGLVAGIGTINADRFGAERARAIVMAYDYTVLAGTQGIQNHRKKDRMFELAERWRLPLVFFTEGGGGRPGDTDGVGVAGLDCLAFSYFGRLSGLVPLVAINSGRCFAGNAALLGCCDAVIATRGSNIGMGGPAMIEGGGLGVFRPDEVGPMSIQVPNGVVDVPVADEAEAVAVARRYLSYFQGALPDWTCADQRGLRTLVPENRLRVYHVRRVIEGLVDTGSVLELRRAFGRGMVTALARIEGRPLGIVANDPTHLSGAIDSDGADKAARFLQLCDAFDLPILFLCDTPGIMVGPEVEKTALVRHASRLFVVGASLTVPFVTVILRKGYGLGAQAMAGGSFKAPLLTVAWPTGEFGGMGLEGAVKLGFRNELAAIDDPAQRRATFQQMVDRMYEHGKAVNMASHFEIDDVIDPAETRALVVHTLAAAPPPPPRTGKKRPCVDPW